MEIEVLQNALGLCFFTCAIRYDVICQLSFKPEVNIIGINLILHWLKERNDEL